MKVDFIRLLKERNLSLTAVRLAVLDTLKQYPHSDAASVYELVQKKISTASIQAVYKNLSILVEHGIIREIKPKGHVSLYETRIDDNHHHIVCRKCESVIDTDCHGCAPCLSPTNDHGFLVEEAEVTFWGICPSCQKSQQKRSKK